MTSTYYPSGGEVSVWRDPLTREDYEGVMRLTRCIRKQGNAEWWEGFFVKDEFGENIAEQSSHIVTRKLAV